MKRAKEFIYGVQYYRAPVPLPDEWEGDIRNIKKMSLNTVQLRPQWRWHERKKGEFYWDDLDRLFDLTDKNNIKVVFKFMLETAPAWLFREYSCERVNIQGAKILPGAEGAFYVGGWLPCFDHRGVREEANRFIETAVKRYKEKKNLLVWNVWNEPRSRPIHECCCEESKRSYRDWLRQKFATIERLNNFLGKAWGDWKDVDPPGRIGDYAEMYLWRQWAMFSVADRVRWVYEEVKKNDSTRPIITHVGGCSVIQDVAGDSSDDWLNAKQVDFYGSSLPVERNPTKTYHRAGAGMICDWIRSVSPYFWINELYPNSANWREEVKVSDLRSWIWSTVAHGAKGILFWQYRAERLGTESNSDGLMNIGGKGNLRSEEVSRIARIIRKHEDIFKTFQVPQSEVAIVYDHRSDLISRIENTAISSSLNFDLTVDYAYKFYLAGSYAIFWNNDIPVDWVSSQGIKDIHKYKLIYLPFPYIIDEVMAKELIRFVERGGFLISEASIGLRAENTWLNLTNPPYGLDRLFGCKEAGRLVIQKPKILSIKKYKMKIPATLMMTWLDIGDAECIGFWDDEKPALTVCKYGDGKAMLIGMHPGATYIDTLEESLNRFIKKILDEAKIEPPVQLNGVKGRVYPRMLADENQRLIFLFNYGDKDEDIVLTKPKLLSVEDLCQVAKVKKEGSGDLCIKLPAGEVACILGNVK